MTNPELDPKTQLKLVTGKTDEQVEQTFSGLEKIHNILAKQKPETFDELDPEIKSQFTEIILFETASIDLDSPRFEKFKSELFRHFVNYEKLNDIPKPRDYWKTCHGLNKQINSILENMVNNWIEQNLE